MPDRVIAFATSRAVGSITDDDKLLAAELEHHDFRVEPAVWNAADVDWTRFHAIIVRSTWDYHLQPDAFLHWLAQVEQLGVTLRNSPDLLRWNLDKRYLRDLSDRGVNVVPTRWVGQNEHTHLADIIDERQWSDFVVKPSVSASAHRTWRGTQADTARLEANYRAEVVEGTVLVQPFIEEVRTHGEWSLLFYGGKYSHAVIKRPQAGDFRVQKEHGGSSEPANAPEHVIEAARDAVAVATELYDAPRYARVDGCVVDGALMLMELELIEPDLFIRAHHAAAHRLADALGFVT